MASNEDGGWTMAERWEYHHNGYDGPEVTAATPRDNPIGAGKGFYAPASSSGQSSVSSVDKDPQTGLIPTNESSFTPNSSLSKGARRSIWTRKRIILAVIAIMMIIGLAVTIPVAIMITRQKIANAQTAAGPPLADNTNNWIPSTQGAYNGTGLATIIPSDDGDGQVILFAQHFNGEIRQAIEKDGHWTGGTTADIVIAADKVRAASPLSAISYTNGGNDTWRLIYIDQNDILQEIVQVNRTGQWQQGGLGDLQLEASESPNAGLSLLRRRTGKEGFADHDETSVLKPLPELQIYYAHKADSRIHELTANGSAWTESFVFPEDADANAGFIAAMPSSNLPTFFFASSTLTGQLISYTQNITASAYWEEIGTQGSAQLRKGSSLTFGTLQNVLVYQDPSNKIVTIQPNLTDLTAPWGPSKMVGADAAIGGTRISAKYNTNQGANEDYLYFQVKGDDLPQYTWTENKPTKWIPYNAPTD